MTSDETPRVWIGSLAAYNAGSLIGEWFDAAEAPTDSREWVDALGDQGVMPTWQGEYVRSRMAEVHEEIWVFDHENFRGLLTGECSPMDAVAMAEALERVGDLDAFEAWGEASEYDTAEQAVSAFEDACYFEGESEQDAAYEYLDGSGAFEGLPEIWESYHWHMAEAWMHSNENGGAIYFRRLNGRTFMFFQ